MTPKTVMGELTSGGVYQGSDGSTWLIDTPTDEGVPLPTMPDSTKLSSS